MLERLHLYQLQRQCMTFDASSDTRAAGTTPTCWTALYAKVSPPGGFTDGIIFLHERISPAGNQRLVVLEYITSGCGTEADQANARIFKLGTALRAPQELAAELCNPFGGRATPFVGRPDPIDESHFMFDAIIDETRHTFDGWLTDDDRVLIERRD